MGALHRALAEEGAGRTRDMHAALQLLQKQTFFNHVMLHVAKNICLPTQLAA